MIENVKKMFVILCPPIGVKNYVLSGLFGRGEILITFQVNNMKMYDDR